MPTILVHIGIGDGGIAEYAHAQAEELAARGYDVRVLAPPSFLRAHPQRRYAVAGHLLEVPARLRWRTGRRALFALNAIVNPLLLAWHVLLRRPWLVLIDAFGELLAPFWAWPHTLLAKHAGVLYATTLHDPVRANNLGSDAWHRRSLRAAYAPLSIALIHDATAAPTGLPAHVRTVEVPHGLFPATRGDSTSDLRETLHIAPDAPVALSFGYVVDRKNLDLAIAALVEVPRLHLIVAGRVGSAADRPVAAYRAQAEALGVADRCHFVERFIADGEIERFFAAATFVLITYRSDFVSQSGVLHVAANWDKPVLASGGEGPLVASVERFGLGRVVAPDSAMALVEGMSRMIEQPYGATAGWEAFRDHASWRRNIDVLLAAATATKPATATEMGQALP